jgi:hypothetical protein
LSGGKRGDRNRLHRYGRGQGRKNRARIWSNWWPPGHIIGWGHTFVHEIHHLLDAIVESAESGRQVMIKY